MILTQTKATGYSLGLPLWWPNNPEQLSTGWLQGISLVLRSNPMDVYLTRYEHFGNHVALTFSTPKGLLCSLTAELGTQPTIYPLINESSDGSFVAGAVTLYGGSSEAALDLTGAMVCPKYITFITPNTAYSKYFTLSSALNGSWIGTIYNLNTLTVESSLTVTVTDMGGNDFKLAVVPETSETVAVNNLVHTINGKRGTGGFASLNLPQGWVAEQFSPTGVKIGNLSDTTSCPETNYLEQRLNPGNFTHECPLNDAYDNGKLKIEKIVCTRYNAEYDTSTDGSPGLHWNEFSKLHDAWKDEE